MFEHTLLVFNHFDDIPLLCYIFLCMWRHKSRLTDSAILSHKHDTVTGALKQSYNKPLGNATVNVLGFLADVIECD